MLLLPAVQSKFPFELIPFYQGQTNILYGACMKKKCLAFHIIKKIHNGKPALL